MSTEPILLLTHSGDYYTIDLVEQSLLSRGARALRINTDGFPTELRLTARFRDSGRELLLEGPFGRIDLDCVPAIWSRRLYPGRMPPHVDARYRSHCVAESRNAFFGIFSLVNRTFWVNPMDRMIAAEAKLFQLQCAREVGLTLPPSLVTNVPAYVPPFHREQQGQVVTKLLGALSQTMDASGDFMYTSAVREQDLEHLDGLVLAPQIFQPMIPKDRELRVIVVGEQLFTGAIDTQGLRHAVVDWRRSTTADDVEWTKDALPADVAEKVLALMKKLGLVYGAVDFIVDPDGRHHFLEINPAGEWGWLQRDLGLPIAEAIADALISGAKA
jgi:glutathione synthase/RimK-type ligase-like ATP-grasp enzyme